MIGRERDWREREREREREHRRESKLACILC